jgi:transcriptional regulator with XRE-family HTH domain
MSVRETARQIGASYATLAGYEQDTFRPSLDRLRALAMLYERRLYIDPTDGSIHVDFEEVA